MKNLEPVVFPQTTAHGALCHYINHDTNKNFQPMNVNYGIFPKLSIRIRNKAEKNRNLAERALEDLEKLNNSI
jgi:methylenetetrahydrofolate--tRNA-(uracil-5-)-methyltransferase